MNAFFATTCLLIAIAPQAEASIFSVKSNTNFYSAPNASEATRLRLPEVRVHVPPIKDNQGFCEFKLMYKIADRSNSALPKSAWARCVSIDQLIPAKPKHDGSMSLDLPRQY
jgi:hypothetical protein